MKEKLKFIAQGTYEMFTFKSTTNMHRSLEIWYGILGWILVLLITNCLYCLLK